MGGPVRGKSGVRAVPKGSKGLYIIWGVPWGNTSDVRAVPPSSPPVEWGGLGCLDVSAHRARGSFSRRVKGRAHLPHEDTLGEIESIWVIQTGRPITYNRTCPTRDKLGEKGVI